MKKQYDAADKAKKAYDAACKVAEEARIAFEKADKDLNVTKGQVEKVRMPKEWLFSSIMILILVELGGLPKSPESRGSCRRVYQGSCSDQ